jgi:ferredoxin
MTVRITIGFQCEGYGQCCYEAEDLFQLGDKPPVRAPAEVDESRRADVERAADVCPMQAITVE